MTPTPAGGSRGGIAIPVLLSILFATGCQDPFAEGRHDLASFRIVAVAAQPVEGGLTELRVLAWSGRGPWWEAPPQVAWTVGELTAEGPVVSLPVATPAEVEVVVTTEDGEVEEAVLGLETPPTPPTLDRVRRARVDLELEDAGRPIEERAAVPAGEDGVVPPGDAARLVAEGPVDGELVRWMATGGQFAELDHRSTDWFAGTVAFDDGEVESTSPLYPGVETLIALAMDGAGGNRWRYVDVAVGSGRPYLEVDGRLFPVEGKAEGPAGFWSARLAHANTTAGIELLDVTPVEDPAGGEAACGQAAGSVFSFAPLAEGWCSRGELDGVQVVVEGAPWP